MVNCLMDFILTEYSDLLELETQIESCLRNDIVIRVTTPKPYHVFTKLLHYPFFVGSLRDLSTDGIHLKSETNGIRMKLDFSIISFDKDTRILNKSNVYYDTLFGTNTKRTLQQRMHIQAFITWLQDSCSGTNMKIFSNLEEYFLNGFGDKFPIYKYDVPGVMENRSVYSNFITVCEQNIGKSIDQFCDRIFTRKIDNRYRLQYEPIESVASEYVKFEIHRDPSNTNTKTFESIHVTISLIGRLDISFEEFVSIVKQRKKDIDKFMVGKLKTHKNFTRYGVPINFMKVDRLQITRNFEVIYTLSIKSIKETSTNNDTEN